MDNGIVLMGEAAKAYVQFKYTELWACLIFVFVFLLGLGIFLYKLFKD